MPEPSSRLPLLPADLHSLNQILVIGGVKQFYASLESRGYGYASWAHGVAGHMAIAGSGTMDYLRGTALMGIGSPIFRILAPTQIKKLRFDLAKAYLRLLSRQVREAGDAAILRDLDAGEADTVHAEGLERNGLSVENWNLHLPLQLLRRLGGEPALAMFWPFLRDVRRLPPHIGLLANLATIGFMYRQAMSDDVRSQQMAAAWLTRNPSLIAYPEIERRLALSLKAAHGSADPRLLAFLAVLAPGPHGVGGRSVNSGRSEVSGLNGVSGDDGVNGGGMGGMGGVGGGAGRRRPRVDRKPLACQVLKRGGDADRSDWLGDDPSMAVYRALMKRLAAP